MDKNTLLAKTDKGRDAMARRVPELLPRLRSLLILVDGKRSLAELEKLGDGLGGGAALLEQLMAHGWVSERDLSVPFQESVPYADSQPFQAASTTLPADAASALSTPPAMPFPEARRLVARFINDSVGPMGEQTAIRVEACKTPAELRALLPRIRDALQNFRGASTVQRFDLEIVPQLPRL